MLTYKETVEDPLDPVPLELVHVEDEDVTPEEKEDVASEPSSISSPPAERHGESPPEEAAVMELSKWSLSDESGCHPGHKQ